MTFEDLGLIDPILDAVRDQGYSTPTPIQEQAIPVLLSEKDLLGCAQTGTGKTAAFSIPIIQLLEQNPLSTKGRRPIRALIVSPTRELALQIGENIEKYSKNTSLRSAVIFGGVKQGSQVDNLRFGVDILVATPGRLLDLMNQGYVSLDQIKHFVLDEADQMLDMGFIHDIRRIIRKLPERRQSLFFSATMPASILDLAHQILKKPESITIEPEKTTAEKVEQSIYFVAKSSKSKLLVHLLTATEDDSIIVFSRTKYGADKIARQLNKADISAEAIHGNKTQASRQRALGNFKEGKTRVLVATDIAARGIDVSGLKMVVNYDLPNIPESYVHRIGRTGRANRSGVAISFCAQDEKPYLAAIQRLIDQRIKVIKDHPYVDMNMDIADKQEAKKQTSGGSGKQRSGKKKTGQRPGKKPESSGGNRSFKPRQNRSSGGRGKGGNRNSGGRR